MKKLTLLLLLFWTIVHSEDVQYKTYSNKTALVIGAQDYEYNTPLDSPLKDADDIAKALRALGFDVTLVKNPKQIRDIDGAVIEFKRKLKERKGFSFFYYSGHGVQQDGNNYLLPTEIDIKEPETIKYEAYDVTRLLDSIQGSENPVNIIILNACRNAMFKGFKSATQGLAGISDMPLGNLIGFATAPGKKARDGKKNGNSIYTHHLLQNLNSNEEVSDIIKKTAKAVSEATGKEQVPWTNMSLHDEVYFKKPLEKPTSSNQFLITIKSEPSGAKIVNSSTGELLGETHSNCKSRVTRVMRLNTA